MKEAAVKPDDSKGGPTIVTSSPGGRGAPPVEPAPAKVGAPEPVMAERPDGTQEEVPLAQQPAPPPLAGMPENSTATPGFEDTPADPIKRQQAEEEQKKSEQP
jgi:hypothetical protein